MPRSREMARTSSPLETGVVVVPPWLFKVPLEMKAGKVLAHTSTEYVMLLSLTVDYE